MSNIDKLKSSELSDDLLEDVSGGSFYVDRNGNIWLETEIYQCKKCLHDWEDLTITTCPVCGGTPYICKIPVPYEG